MPRGPPAYSAPAPRYIAGVRERAAHVLRPTSRAQCSPPVADLSAPRPDGRRPGARPTRITSPVTRSRASTSRVRPSRTTRARNTSRRSSASMARCARSSVTNPIATLRTSTAAMATTSATSPIAAATAAATTRSNTSTLRTCPSSDVQADVGWRGAKAFGPWYARRRAASDAESPSSLDLRAPSASPGWEAMPVFGRLGG